jgi:hypothetical protein
MPDEQGIPTETNQKPPKNPHEKDGVTFARIFANELALSQMEKEKPAFPVGSIIVREKLLQAADIEPEVITVMVKREKGFCEKCGDWEFFVLEGNLNKVVKQEKAGSCQKCHTNAENTDFVFRTYLKNIRK